MSTHTTVLSTEPLYPTRDFSDGGVPAVNSVNEQLRKISEKIGSLEKFEYELAQSYGMVVHGKIDSEEILEETRARALSGNDSQAEQVLQRLRVLESLRRRKAEILRPSLLRWRTSEPTPLPLVDPSRFWVVLIGIDAYESAPLHGCVSDALLMKEYIIQDLRVPEDHVQCLLGPANTEAGITIPDNTLMPTRGNIIETLLGLTKNPEINIGDIIIIYFSGHGNGFCDRITYGTPYKVQYVDTIISIDDAFISDREINSILTQISSKKGNRITFITDSDYAGSFFQFTSDDIQKHLPGASQRYHTISSEEILRTGDKVLKDLLGYQSILSKDWHPDMSSHVVLSSCRAGFQIAQERHFGSRCYGVFTEALIRTLRSGGLTSKSTYVDLIDALPRLGEQTPGVAGDHKYSRLWSQDPPQ